MIVNAKESEGPGVGSGFSTVTDDNEYDLAALAVLPVEGTSGTSPQGESSPFRLVAPPAGRPDQYFLFPRSELNLIERKEMNWLQEITLTEQGVTARVVEDLGSGVALYHFRRLPEFLPAYADYTDGYWRLHRALEQDGRLDHTVEECRRRVHPLPIRVWRDGAWTTLRVPSQYSTTSAP